MDIRKAKWDPKQKERLDGLIRNSFSDFVRRERRNLLLAASLSIFICLSRSTPTEASLLIFKLDKLSPKHVYIFLSCMCLYTLVVFWLYALPEFRAARKEWFNKDKIHNFEFEASQPLWAKYRDNIAIYLRYKIWISFEYILPVIISIFAILFLIWRICCPI